MPNRGRSLNARPCSYADFSTTEAFSISGRRISERKERDIDSTNLYGKASEPYRSYEVNPETWTEKSGSSESHPTPTIPLHSVVHASTSLQILMGSNSPTMSGFSSSCTPPLETPLSVHTPL